MAIVRRAIQKYRADGFLELVREGSLFAVRSFRQSVIDPILFKLWERGYLSLDSIYPESYYQYMTRKEAMEDAEEFGETVIDRYNPESVIDLGCGVGRFLKPFADRDIMIRGVEGSEKAIENAITSSDRLTQYNLRQPLTGHDRADIVLCLEVVEHLPESSADTIARSIAEAGETAIITTARPGQGGKHHKNEQPPEYWIEKLSAAGMDYDERATMELRKSISPSSLEWLSDNLLVFETNRS